MTSYAAVHMVAQRTANTTEQGAQHTQQRDQRVVPFRHVTPVLRVLAIACGFCFVFRLSQLVTSSHGGTSCFAFLVAWFPSRW